MTAKPNTTLANPAADPAASLDREITLDQQWSIARAQLDTVKASGRRFIYEQVVLGAQLNAIKKALGFTPGGDRRSSGQVGHLIGSGTWQDHLDEEFDGLPRRTADRFIATYHGAIARIKRLGGLDSIALTLDGLTDGSKKVDDIHDALRLATDGSSQSDLLRELRLVKLPQGSAARGGDLGGRDPDRDPDPVVTAQQMAFSFLREPLTILADFRANPDYRILLAALPPRGDAAAQSIGLRDLEDLCDAIKSDIRELKTHTRPRA